MTKNFTEIFISVRKSPHGQFILRTVHPTDISHQGNFTLRKFCLSYITLSQGRIYRLGLAESGKIRLVQIGIKRVRNSFRLLPVRLDQVWLDIGFGLVNFINVLIPYHSRNCVSYVLSSEVNFILRSQRNNKNVIYIDGVKNIISRRTKFPWPGTGCEGAGYKGQVARGRITWASRHGARRGGGGCHSGQYMSCQKANWRSLWNQESNCHGTHNQEEVVIKHSIKGELSWASSWEGGHGTQ
jgi:hypothetical protein